MYVPHSIIKLEVLFVVYCCKDQPECISRFRLYMTANFLNSVKISDIDLVLIFRSVFFNLKNWM